MINGNERKAFYHIFLPKTGNNGVENVNETRLNDNFKTVGDEFRKLWAYIKNGFKTKALEVEEDATIGGDANIAGNANINGEASVDGNVAADLVIARAIDVAEYAQVGTDITVNDNATVGGVLDVTNRRAQAVLSSPGWYRVMTYAGTSTYQPDGATGALVRFNIVVYGSTSVNGNHQIDLSTAYGTGHREFVNELSNGQDTLIDKIRYTKKGNNFYVDVHFTGNSGNTVSVWFDPKTTVAFQARFTSSDLEAVADAPSGETVVTTYDLHQSGVYVGDLFVNGQGFVPFLRPGDMIAANSDLNTFMMPGVWYSTAAVTPTLSNSSITTVGFKLIVMPGFSGLWQIELSASSECIMALRYCADPAINPTWGAWKRLTPA